MKQILKIGFGFYEHQLNGQKHRVDGPAILFDGDSIGDWYLYDKEHRYYGPAGDLMREWWIHGKYIKSENVIR